jgi:hypothetical protein
MIRSILCAWILLSAMVDVGAQTTNSDTATPQKTAPKVQPRTENSKPTNKSPSKKRKSEKPLGSNKAKKPTQKDSESESSNKSTSSSSGTAVTQDTDSQFSISVSLGYESIFGNGVTAGYWPSQNFTFGLGTGYSYSGLRGGVYSLVGMESFSSLYLLAGAALGISAGRSDKISFDAKFTPESSTTEEPITASRRFELSPAQLFSILTGMRWKISNGFSANILANYNFVVGGNQLRFTDDIEFSDSIIPSNLESFNQEFDRRSHDLLLAGGLGASIGLEFGF